MIELRDRVKVMALGEAPRWGVVKRRQDALDSDGWALLAVTLDNGEDVTVEAWSVEKVGERK